MEQKQIDDILKGIANNQILFDALKIKLLSKFSLSKVPHKGLDDTLLGQTIRAKLVGRELVEEALYDVMRLKEGNTQLRVNIAR